MLNTLTNLATIAALGFYIFVEWPKIQKRWKETYPAFEKFLIIVSVVSGLLMVISLILAVISIFIKSQLVVTYIFAFAAMFGFSYLLDYWIENKTLAYRQTSSMRSIWLLMILSLIVGVIGIVLYIFGF